MKLEYNIIGMACEHCVATVKSALEDLPDVQSVSVDKASDSAVIEMNSPIALIELQKQLETKNPDWRISARN